jgi:transposase
MLKMVVAIAAASRIYQVSIWCVDDWCKRDQLEAKLQTRRSRKLDWSALRHHLRENPDALLRERAQHFGVNINAIWYACRQMKLTTKKNSTLHSEKSSSTD